MLFCKTGLNRQPNICFHSDSKSFALGNRGKTHFIFCPVYCWLQQNLQRALKLQDLCLFHLTSATLRRRGFLEEDFACSDQTLALTSILADEPRAPSSPRGEVKRAAMGWTSRSLNAAGHSVSGGRSRSYPGATHGAQQDWQRWRGWYRDWALWWAQVKAAHS